jgi:hypothetical protein
MICFAVEAQLIVYFTSRERRLQKLRRAIGNERKRFSWRPLHRSANQKEILLLVDQTRKESTANRSSVAGSVRVT